MKSPKSKVFPAMLDTHSTTFTKQKLAGWPLIPGLHRMRRRFGSRMRSGQSPGSSLATLQTSWNPSHTLRSLRAHRWSLWDGQYLLLAVLGIFSLFVIEHPGPLVKTLISALLMLSLIFPITRQFFLPFFPIASWLVLFYSSRYVDPFLNIVTWTDAVFPCCNEQPSHITTGLFLPNGVHPSGSASCPLLRISSTAPIWVISCQETPTLSLTY